MYQSTNSVVRADPMTASVRSAVFDLVKRLVEIAAELFVLLLMRRFICAAIRRAINVAIRCGRRNVS